MSIPEKAEGAAAGDPPAHLLLKQGGLTLIYERAAAKQTAPRR